MPWQHFILWGLNLFFMSFFRLNFHVCITIYFIFLYLRIDSFSLLNIVLLDIGYSDGFMVLPSSSYMRYSLFCSVLYVKGSYLLYTLIIRYLYGFVNILLSNFRIFPYYKLPFTHRIRYFRKIVNSLESIFNSW